MKTKYYITLILIASLVLVISAKTRWSSNHIIPDADFIGSGELIVGYEGFLNYDSTGSIQLNSLVPVTLGMSEWLTTSIGWSEGVTFGFKGRILDEYRPAMPSVAIGVRNLYNNSMLGRSQIENDQPDVTGELYLALSKGFELITTRFHGGITSIPDSETEKINGFLGVEKYFGGDFYMTLEGWSFQDRLNLALFGTFRFLPNDRGEFYAGLIDIERLLFNKHDDLELSLDADSPLDPIKPGITMGVNINFSFPFGSQTQFRTVEDNYGTQQSQIDHIKLMQDTLRLELETEKDKNELLSTELAAMSLRIVDPVILPEYYEQIYARLLLYREFYIRKPFDPEKILKIRNEIFAFEEHAENTLIRVVQKGDRNRNIEIDAVSLLGMMRSTKSVELLLEKLGSEMDRRYKIEIISSLGMIGDRGATYALKHLINSSDVSVATAAREVLSSWNTGDETVVDSLNEKFIVE